MFMSLLENCIGKPIDLVKHSWNSSLERKLMGILFTDSVVSIGNRTTTVATSNSPANIGKSLRNFVRAVGLSTSCYQARLSSAWTRWTHIG
jgi:hypothetical protein